MNEIICSIENPAVQAILSAYIGILQLALPITLCIASFNICFNCILAAFTNGKFHLGGGR